MYCIELEAIEVTEPSWTDRFGGAQDDEELREIAQEYLKMHPPTPQVVHVYWHRDAPQGIEKWIKALQAEGWRAVAKQGKEYELHRVGVLPSGKALIAMGHLTEGMSETEASLVVAEMRAGYEAIATTPPGTIFTDIAGTVVVA